MLILKAAECGLIARVRLFQENLFDADGLTVTQFCKLNDFVARFSNFLTFLSG